MGQTFRIYGYYRTGTNWLATLLRANVPDVVVLDVSDEKHYTPLRGLPEPGTIAICIAKHPLALVTSFKRFRPDTALADVVVNYNNCLATTLQAAAVKPKQWRLLCYEQLLASPAEMLKDVVGYPLQLTDPVPEEVDRHGERGARFTRRDYYLEQQYLAELTKDEIALVNSKTDWDALSQFGYAPAGEAAWL